jgi:spermidine synthase
MRSFTVLFGGTVLAATATVSSFFLGSTAGSLALGALSPRWRRPLLAFGFLEIGVGLGALLVRPILGLYVPLYARLHGPLAPHPVGFAVVKLALATVAVGLPTFSMGGTLPVLAEAVAAGRARLGIPVGGLYAFNLLGAAAGAFAVPFLLLPGLGVGRSHLAVVAGSLIVGTIAAALGARDAGEDAAAPSSPATLPARERAVPRPPVRLLAFWSGACTLGLQVLWMRMFSLVHENSVYSFALVLVVFLIGLSGGAALARWGLRRQQSASRLLAGGWACGALWITLTPWVFFNMTGGLEYLPTADPLASNLRLVWIAVVTLLPACVALGTALPLLMEMASVDAGRPNESAGPTLGRLLSVNTAGAIVGPLVVTFLLAPRLGLWGSIVVLGTLTGLVAMRGLAGRERAAIGVALTILVIATRPLALPPVRVRTAAGERLVSVREGSYGTTAVVEDARDRWITVNNAYVLGGSAAASEERWQGHLPLLLHPRPRRVAFVGLGTGITAGAARIHRVDEIAALEIVPEVVEAARADFVETNDGVLTDPRTRVVVDDGRNALATAARPFDVIVGDLLVPWRPAEAGLYTEEHFQSVARALAPDGVFCQWLPLYQLSPRQLAILARTFVHVFPRTTVWRGNFLGGEPTLGLVGHRDGRPLDVAGIDARVLALGGASVERNPFLKHPAGAWLFLVGSLSPDLAWLADVPTNRDDRPWVELLSARRDSPAVGSDMESRLALVADAPLADTPLASLDGEHRAWRDTGMALGRASLVSGPEGERGLLALLRTLPAALRQSLDVPAN